MSSQPSLVSLIDARLRAGEVELPVFDDVAQRIHREVRESRLDADGICAILQQDPVLVTEVLRMANSSFFSGLSEVRNLREATVRLGIRQIASIVFSVKQKRMYSASKGPFKKRMVVLWRHASAVSVGARWLALHTGYRSLADDVFVAGLVHDVGKLSLLRIMEDILVAGEARLSDRLVDAALDHLHCRHGAELLAMWNLPETFREIVLHQADETFDESNVALCIVRLVDRACALEGVSDRPDETIVLESLRESEALGLSEIDLAELRLVIEDNAEGAREAA